MDRRGQRPNRLFRGRPPARDASEARILVVGSDSIFKSRVAQELQEAANAANLVDNAGAAFVRREDGSEEPKVIDTTPFETNKDWSRDDTARIWVSQNSLRQRSGQIVCVVCTISLSDVDDEIFREPNFERNEFCWLHVLTSVFEESQKKIVFLVNCSDSTRHATKQRLGPVLKKYGFSPDNIIFTLQNVLRSIVNPGRAGDETATESNEERTENVEATEDNGSAAIPHFRLPKIAQCGLAMYRPWGPANIILFGLSGSGKSTFAKMLTTGQLDGVDSLSTKFATSSGLRGQTKDVVVGQGRGWRVVDTPGLGERNNDSLRGVSTDGAARRIRYYVSLLQGKYTHFIYVFKKGRVNDADKAVWGIFNNMFGDVNITIVVSGADPEWIDANKSDLQLHFPGCSNFLPANFESIPPEMVGDTESELDYENARLEALEGLEAKLASLCGLDVSCRLGKWSIGTQRSLLASGGDGFITPGTHIRQGYAFDSGAVHEPQPSDYETCRSLLRIKSLTSRTFLPGRKLDLKDDIEYDQES